MGAPRERPVSSQGYIKITEISKSAVDFDVAISSIIVPHQKAILMWSLFHPIFYKELLLNNMLSGLNCINLLWDYFFVNT